MAKRSTAARMSGIDIDNDFLRWFVSFQKLQGAHFQKGEFLMTPLASRRFAIGIDDDGRTILGALPGEVEMLDFIGPGWKSASMVRNVRGNDWLVLSASSFGESASEMPFRLWLPVQRGLLDGWQGEEGGVLHIRPMLIVDGQPVLEAASSLERVKPLNLTLAGDWTFDKAL